VMAWPSDDPKLANHVRITPGKGLEIDGKEFPWYLISEPDPVVVKVGRKQMTTVTIQIPCNSVEVLDADLPDEGYVDERSMPIFRTEG
jgi:hypothetical protein